MTYDDVSTVMHNASTCQGTLLCAGLPCSQGNGLQVPTEGQTLQQQPQQQIAKQGSCDLDEVQEELPSMDD